MTKQQCNCGNLNHCVECDPVCSNCGDRMIPTRDLQPECPI